MSQPNFLQEAKYLNGHFTKSGQKMTTWRDAQDGYSLEKRKSQFDATLRLIRCL